APSPGVRRLGAGKDILLTDAETAFVRREKGRVTEAGLAGGGRLEVGGSTLIEVGPEVASAHVRYKGEVAEVSTRGRGTARVATGTAVRLVLNGKPVEKKPEAGQYRLEVGTEGEVTITAP